MKLAIWDILAVLVVVLLCIMGVIFAQIFLNPYSAINPFPPPTMPAMIVLPSATQTPRKFPTAGPTGITGTPIGMAGTLTPATPVLTPGTGTVFVIPSWTPSLTPSLSPTVTRTLLLATTPAGGGGGVVIRSPTAGPSPTKSNTPSATAPPNISGVVEVSGTKSNVWQKTNNSPVFRWKVSMDMFDYFWYFGPNPNGESDQQRPIQHDSQYVELAPFTVRPNLRFANNCGVYYLRVQTRYAIKPKSGGTVKYMVSNWDTVFIFKYDAQPPQPPYFASVGIPNAIRGIQNISPSPRFTWSWVDGVAGSTMGSATSYVSGDYVPWDEDLDGDYDSSLLCTGIKGYYVYWGPDPNGVGKSRWTTRNSFSPPAVPPNVTYYLRVQAVDKLDNRSEWRTVALDEAYEPPALPTLAQAAFYYDRVPPNNITNIIATSSGGAPLVSGGPWTNDSFPSFEFVGGEDPIGWNNNQLRGYQVVWNTLMNEKYDFQEEDTFTPQVTKSGIYYLRVRALDYAGNTSKEWYTFVYKFDNVGPTSITNVKATNELNKALASKTWYRSVSTINFSFNTNVKDPGNSKTASGLNIFPSIGLYFGTDPQGAYSETIPKGMGTQTRSYPVAGDGVYYFRAYTVDDAGNETWTTPFVLKVDGTPPTEPTRIIEKNGAISGSPFNSSTPTFTWNGATDATSGIKGYKIHWGTAPFGGDPATKPLRTGTSYSPGKVAKGTYYLQIWSVDNAGNISSAPAEFVYLYQ